MKKVWSRSFLTGMLVIFIVSTGARAALATMVEATDEMTEPNQSQMTCCVPGEASDTSACETTCTAPLFYLKPQIIFTPATTQGDKGGFPILEIELLATPPDPHPPKFILLS